MVFTPVTIVRQGDYTHLTLGQDRVASMSEMAILRQLGNCFLKLPFMVKRALPTAWWFRCLLTLATYIIAADFLPTLLLVAINSIGYLPEGDRPGPGWQTPHLPRLDELRIFCWASPCSFGPLQLPLTARSLRMGAGILGFCRLPRWALRTVAVGTCNRAGGLLMAVFAGMVHRRFSSWNRHSCRMYEPLGSVHISSTSTRMNHVFAMLNPDSDPSTLVVLCDISSGKANAARSRPDERQGRSG